MKKAIVAIMAIGLLFGLGGTAAFAANWARLPAAGPGDWSVEGNWDTGVPSGEAAGINNGGTAQITVAGDPLPSITWLRLGDGGSDTGTVEHSAGTVTVTSGWAVLGGWGTGTYELSGGMVDVTGGALGYSLFVAKMVGSSGTFTQTGGALKLAQGLVVGRGEQGAATGAYSLSGADSTLEVGTKLAIGEFGTATGRFEVAGGGSAINVSGNMSVNAYSTVAVKPYGANLSPFNVGLSGSGDVTLTSGCELEVDFSMFALDPLVGETLTVINKTSAGAIGGTFKYDDPVHGLVDLTNLTYTAPGVGGDVEFTVSWGSSYNGGDGNDLVLTVTSAVVPVPEPASAAMLLLGLGGLVVRRRRK